MSRLLPLFIGLLCSISALAWEAKPAVEDPVLEARVMAISEHLRCLVCQNQTIADSNAGLAIDLRNQVREMLQKGMDEKQVVDFMVQRYGDFVLYKPPVKPTTWLLWAGPFLLFGFALAMLFVKLKNRRQQIVEPLSEQDHRAAVQMLEGTGRKDHIVNVSGDEKST